jgi:alpha-L-arabinofuranosidase
LIVKVINYSAAARSAEIRVNGMHAGGTGKATILASADPGAENSFEHPKAVAPEFSSFEVKSGTVTVQLRAYSLNVYRIPIQQ